MTDLHDPALSALDEFYFSQELGNVEIENDLELVGQWRWMPILRGAEELLALNIIAGETALSPLVAFRADAVWRFRIAQTLPTLSADGLTADFIFRPDGGGRELLLLTVPMEPDRVNDVSATIDLRQLAGLRGRLGIRCTPGPLGDASSDWLAIVQWIAGREDRLGLLNGRSNRAFRLKNEIRAFNVAYEHAYFEMDPAATNGEAPAAEWKPAPPITRDAPLELHEFVTADALAALPVAAVEPDDNILTYSARLLWELTGNAQFINFSRRFRKRVGRRLRMLSVCTGGARIERELLADARIPVDLTLLDINEKLMGQAAHALAPFGTVTRILGDVNEISVDQFDGQFDVVVAVSALHHVVELERVLRTIRDLLYEDGEFWVICEQVGRNGNRLWPEAAEVANRIFRTLPEELRRNVHTGAIDEEIADTDFSTNSMEGIRSAEIMPLLEAYFRPIKVTRRNCFMWRIVEATYHANYDLRNEVHRRCVLEFVAAEYNLSVQGGRPSEYSGVFQRLR